MHVCCVHVKTCWSLLPSAFGRICCWSAQDLMPWMKTLWGKPSAQLMVLQGSPAYSMAWHESFVEVAYCWLWKVVTMSPCLVVSKTVQPFFLSISIFFLCGMMTCNNWFVQVAWNSPGMLCHLAWVLLQRTLLHGDDTENFSSYAEKPLQASLKAIWETRLAHRSLPLQLLDGCTWSRDLVPYNRFRKKQKCWHWRLPRDLSSDSDNCQKDIWKNLMYYWRIGQNLKSYKLRISFVISLTELGTYAPQIVGWFIRTPSKIIP